MNIVKTKVKKLLTYIIILIVGIVAVGCSDRRESGGKNSILLSSGDFWVDKFDKHYFQNAIIYKNNIYCNTVEVLGDSNFLYSLNLSNGLVNWSKKLDAYATQPVSIYEEVLFYCSYLGHIYAIDKEGNELWKTRYERPYSGHMIDSSTASLLIKSPTDSEISYYNINTGELIDKVTSDSLVECIDDFRNNVELITKEYSIRHKGKKYEIKSKKNEDGYNEISIELLK